ncbi:TetR family transcriptional regulator [Flavobacterium sp. 90]|uniref:TetR/AcrR family transcriptional regulator n=1 Tax=unclassified Flavobacterium TaxID=196869 RepID=UPI000EAF365C|nr:MULTISPECIES: TetR/AcrR family transcriptional regulator [unclassified Flavobacterium]RKR05266.1 TetR family transcriptional regulator [Flavobacterium sp. 81]TCK56581.1 TetR family transcriptional regulator [Flavobacterium sp. 90]
MQPKERILDTVSVLFHKQGYNATGINQIIEEAKVAKASFYQHFKSKEDLCAAFLNQRHDYWFEQLEKFVSDEKESKRRVIASFDFLIFMNQKENFRGCSFLNILSEIPSDNVKILSVIQSHKSDLRNYFKIITENELIADHVYLLFESCIIESQLFKSNNLIEQSKKIIQTLNL